MVKRFLSSSAALVAVCFLSPAARAQTAPLTNSVSSSGLVAYLFNGSGTPNPTLTLQRGVTYVFNVSAFDHPFDIKTNSSLGNTDRYNVGVTGQGANNGSTLTFSVPLNAPTQLVYHCELHTGMVGFINTIAGPPPGPPTVRIISFAVTPTGVKILSTGTNGWSAIPEFSSNLLAQVWTTVPLFTNVFANGTNTTTFNRPDVICGSNVFLRIRNQSS